MMKQFFLLATFLFSSTFITYANVSPHEAKVSLEQNKSKTKYAFLVQNDKGLKSSIMTAVEMKAENTTIEFEIVIMGPVVAQLNDSTLLTSLESASKAGIKLVVCEFALKVFGLQLQDIPSFIQGTPNAHKYMFALQDNGYNTLSI